MAESDSELGAVIAAYLDAPGAPDPAALFAAHPHLAPQLRAFLAADGTLERLAAPLRSRDDPAPGAGVGAYTVLEKAGEGGMGVVYRARDERLGREVALKLIHAGRHASPAERARFRVEAEAAARLSHTGIVRVFEVGEHDGLPYLAVEYCAGGTLADRLVGGPLAPAEAAAVLAALAEAVQAAHDGQVLHRDLKPGNVLFDAGRPRIADFGLAKLLDARADLTRTGVLLGSPPYMAPEQAAGRPDRVGPATDVYALGAILFEALTGRPPFRGDTPLDTLRQVTDDPPPRPRALNPAVPADLETVCLRCLEKEPARRFATASDLAAELGRFLRGEPVRSRPVGPAGRAWRWCRRYPAVAALGGLVVAVSAVGGGVSAYFAAEAGGRAEALTGALGQADASAAAAGRARDEADDLRGKEASARGDAERRAGQEASARADAERETRRAGRELDRAEDLLYLLRVRAAHDGWLAGDPVAAAAALDACRWDRRGWEHDFLATVLDGDRAALESALWAGELAVSPDGTRVVGGEGGMHTARVWDARTARILFRLAGHSGRVEAVAFAADGKSILTGSVDGTVRRWDATTGAERARFDVGATADGAEVRAVAFAPGGGRAAFADRDGNVRVWDAGAGRATPIPRGPGDGDTAVSFSPDGARLAVLRLRADPRLDGPPVPTGRVVEVATGRDVFTLPGGSAVAFSPDGKYLARVGEDGAVHLHAATDGREVRALDADARGVTFAPDGQRLAVGTGSGAVGLWDVEAGRELVRRFPASGAHMVGGLAFGPDGRWLVAGACAKVGSDCVYPVVVWNTVGGVAAPRLAGPKGAGQVLVSADGTRAATIASEEGGALAAWDTHTGRQTLYVPNPAEWLSPAASARALAPSGTLLVTGTKDGPVRAWDVAAGREAEPFAGHAGPVRWVAFAAGGARLATFAEQEPAPKGPQLDGSIRVWNVAGRRVVFRTSGFDQTDPAAPPLRATSVAVSADGKAIAAGFPTGRLRVWDADSGKLTFEFQEPSGRIERLALSADGRTVAARLEAGRGNVVAVWDVPAGRRRHEFPTPAGTFGEVTLDLRFSPDGSRLALVVNEMAAVWDVAAGAVLHSGHGTDVSADCRRVVGGGRVWTAGPDTPLPVRLQEPPGAGGALRFLPDGRRLVQATETGLAVWDAGSGHRLLFAREPLGSVGDVAVSADGSRVVCRTADGTVRVWAALKPAVGLLLDDPSGLGGATAAGFLPGGREVAAVGGLGPSLRVWDARTGRLRLQVPGATGRLAVSGDGTRVAAENPDRRVRVWDVETGRELATTDPIADVAAVALDRTGSRLAVAPRTHDGPHVVRVSAVGADMPPVVMKGHERHVRAVAFSPDGTRVVTGSTDHSVLVWDARTGAERFALKGFFPSLTAVGYSADGGRVLVQDRPDRTRAWDAATGEPLPGVADAPAGVSARSPDGRYRLDGTRLTDTTLAARREGWDAEKLAAWALPDADYHRREAAAALAAGNAFAHAFHAARAGK